MQDRYVGDIGDYVKYGLLRALSRGKRLGVAWYLFPNECNNDGKKTGYLDKPEEWRHIDPDLFDRLAELVRSGNRSVQAVEDLNLLPGAKFSSERLDISLLEPGKWRINWFDRVMKDLETCDIVFADPDNSLCETEKYRFEEEISWKRIPLSEAHALSEGRCAVIYHHYARQNHESQIREWQKLLGIDCVAVRWRGEGPRVFFIVNPTDEITQRAKEFTSRQWGFNSKGDRKCEFVPAN